ncbi:glycoside hydrolase/phage tail family protein [Paracoccaceae bacterium Fryx2]|nr:glycoside hydrolase/phage tail family protein [Paracoccaceae bacterium Fryx2]
MATILLSAAGAAIGSGFGGTVLGLSGAVIGRAVGATLGRVIDQRLMGAGSEAVEIGRVDRFRLMGASEGTAVARVFGRVRIAGQVIWATRFQEDVTRSGGGKGAPKPKSAEYSYSVSLAVALCEGRITSVGRIWADGVEISPQSVNLRLYPGDEAQLPDPKIEAVEGAGMAPAFRGIAYVVIEDLGLSAFGNRVPQFSFEVVRAAQGGIADQVMDLQRAVSAVALIPGSGEYALATTPVHYSDGPGVNRSANVNSPSGEADLATALGQLREELPGVGSVSLIVSWFGGDLRCASCEVRPKVEQTTVDGEGMPWSVARVARADAVSIVQDAGRPIYGGTPADRSVIEAIAAIRAGGQEVMFYPFILMDQLAGNALPDPWSGAEDQPVLPWRGRITLSQAPGRAGSPDRSALAEAEVAAFFGTAQPGDFSVSGDGVAYSGPDEWGYRRFILHYAHLCALAGGVDAFCIGSEMRGLTQIRGAGDSFPAVAALRVLAGEVRAILGPATKISYAADWSEYFGYHADGNVYFHLDPLWADPDIDFVGIDNYMPLSDWRDGSGHADAGWGTIYNLDYLKANIAGGEGYDWYYDSPEGEAAQVRKPITDGAYGEPWVFRYKDLKGWWSQPHHDRIDGVRAAVASPWVPGSKPIRFAEYGCAAIDKGCNQPNKFLDPKSSESLLPKFSNGRRDDLMQMQYLRAMAEYWGDVAHNPVSESYGAPMVDMARAHVWAWDSRPFPQFPNTTGLWSDGGNYPRGHWLTGRATGQALAAVVAEICERSGVGAFDVSGLYGVVRGYSQAETGAARAALQPLMLAYGFEAVERAGVLQFRMRDARAVRDLALDRLAVSAELDGLVETARAPEAETAGRVRLGYIEAEGNFDLRQAEAIFPDEVSFGVSQSELPLVLTAAEGRGLAERWLAEARVARDGARFALPRSAMDLGAGDVVALEGALYRIDRVEQAEALLIDAVRVEPGVYEPSDAAEERVVPRAFVAPVPTFPVFLDLPLLTGEEVPHAPHVAVAATPWPGSIGVWSSAQDDGYELNRLMVAPAIVGVTQTPLVGARAGLWDRGAPLRLRVFGGALSSASDLAVMNGANAAAIGDGSSDRWEVFQFADAVLVGPQTYELGRRLRGQAGSDGVMPQVWPVGSIVVLLTGAVQQIDLAASARGLARHYRFGAAARGYDDPAVVHRIEAFQGIGLRPFAPVHLEARRQGGDLALSWVRRSRIDGDSWQSSEVPLGEEREAYLLRVVLRDTILREVALTAPGWVYPAGMQAVDGLAGAFRIEVAQVSDRFGPGPFRAIDLVV